MLLKKPCQASSVERLRQKAGDTRQKLKPQLKIACQRLKSKNLPKPVKTPMLQSSTMVVWLEVQMKIGLKA